MAESRNDTLVPRGQLHECAFGCDEAVLNHAQELVKPQGTPHFLQPGLCLPRSDGLVAPEHQDAITSVQIGGDFRLRKTATVEVLQKDTLAFKTRIGDRQAACDSACGRRHQFIKEPTGALAGIGPQLIEYRDYMIAPCRAGIVARDGRDYRSPNCDLVSGNLGLDTQERRAFYDSSDRCENAANRLLIVIGRTDCLGETAAKQQNHRDHVDGRERCFARLLWAGIDLLWIEQSAVRASSKRML